MDELIIYENKKGRCQAIFTFTDESIHKGHVDLIKQKGELVLAYEDVQICCYPLSSIASIIIDTTYEWRKN